VGVCESVQVCVRARAVKDAKKRPKDQRPGSDEEIPSRLGASETAAIRFVKLVV